MKKTLMLLFLFSSIILAQHTKELIRTPTFPGDLRNFSSGGNKIFVVGYDIYSTGEVSFIASSTDKGRNWKMLPMNTINDKDQLTAICFIDENKGWVAGNNGTIYKTTDGGQSWVSQKDTLVYKGGLNDIYFFNADTGYACGSVSNSAHLLKTVNGGATWTVVPTPSTRTLYRMIWENKQRCIITASSKTTLLSTDGGETWVERAHTVVGTSVTLQNITMTSDSTYFICGKGSILKSTDHGTTFTQVTTPGIDAALNLYAISFFDASNGVVAGSGGVMFFTNDGGATWTVKQAFTSEVIKSIYKIDSNTMLAGTYKSNLFKTTNKGADWMSYSNSDRDFYGIYAEDSLNIVIAGGSAASVRGEINLSTDGGKTWDKLPLVISNLLYDAVKFGNYIYTCGRDGAYFISDDKGQTWQNENLPTTTARNYKLQFLSQQNGYMVTSDGKILRTTNRGADWTTVQQLSGNPYVYSISMISPTRGFAVGAGERIYETMNGNTWQHGVLATPVRQVTGLFMLNDSQGYICTEKGGVYKTEDGFRNVTLMTDTVALNGYTIRNVFAFNDSTVWAVGAKGLILRSHGRDSMAVVDTALFNEDLSSIARLNDTTIVIAGYGGSVYKISERKPIITSVSNSIYSAKNYALNQNYPNPFNPVTRISFTLPSAGNITLKVYDILGREAATLVNGFKNAGSHTVSFDASLLSSGVYFYELRAGSFISSRKMILMK